MPVAQSFRDTDSSVHLKGLRELQRSMRKAADGAGPEFRKELKGLGGAVLGRARSNAPVGPRPKRSSTRPLAASLRIAVNAKGVSIYSNEPHAYVQDRGGRVGKGAIITRARASGYLTRAVRDGKPETTAAIERLLDKLDSQIKTT